MTVPPFKKLYPSVSDMDSAQLTFYRHLVGRLEQGERVDVDGQISYVFVYLYGLISSWDKTGFDGLHEYLTRLGELYSTEPTLALYCRHWGQDCLLGLALYDEYLDQTEPEVAYGTSTHRSNLRLNVQRECGREADPIDILLIAGRRKTQFIIENHPRYREAVRSVFSEYGGSRGGWFEILDRWVEGKRRHAHRLFDGVPLHPKPTLQFPSASYYAAYSRLSEIRALAREAESQARASCGLPRIGEGWVAETELYRRLKSAFPETVVLQHGRPTWLGRQHFDVWLPVWKVAVEYHGPQHFKPVDFFGGQEAFERTVERDQRKLALAKSNGVVLYAVTAEDDQNELIAEIARSAGSRVVPVPGGTEPP
jgi:hypothetical protein